MKKILVLGLALTLTGCADEAKKWAYESAISAEQWRAGLEPVAVTTDDGLAWHLLRSEEDVQDKPVVLLVHGFGADSSNWVRFANELEDDYRFIIPDLPGHGRTTRDLSLDYGIEAQAARLLSLADKLGVERFHLAGSSMGGAISLAMSLQAPERVQSLSLVDAAGVTIKTDEFTALIADGNNPLIPHAPEDMHQTMTWAMAQLPWMPDFFVEQMGALKAANAAVAEKVHADIRAGMEMRTRLPEVSVPTLVLWGKLDRLLSVENAEVFAQEIVGSEVVIFDDIGHLPMVEAPARSAQELARFWRERGTQL